MHEIPETMAQVADLVARFQHTAHPLTEPEVIAGGLQNWIQELLGEAFEGGYLTASLTASGLTITDISDAPIYQSTALSTTDLVPRFQADPHATLLWVQTQIRQAITAGHIRG